MNLWLCLDQAPHAPQFQATVYSFIPYSVHQKAAKLNVCQAQDAEKLAVMKQLKNVDSFPQLKTEKCFEFTLPPKVHAGQVLHIRIPSGLIASFVVPSGAKGGQKVVLQVKRVACRVRTYAIGCLQKLFLVFQTDSDARLPNPSPKRHSKECYSNGDRAKWPTQPSGRCSHGSQTWATLYCSRLMSKSALPKFD